MGSTALLLVKLFAPNAEQMYLVNHLKDSPAEEKRNVLEENARRAHGDIQDLADLNSSKPEAVIIPMRKPKPKEYSSLYMHAIIMDTLCKNLLK
ncbi:glyoxalase ElbB-like isoform X4 [Mirounga angustirostris]|uniref:glyoxalase ElbB-like isoform X4 n=1 Tax=Mirounga angustirostris TaxID=9716 RepID=UPI00313B0DF2